MPRLPSSASSGRQGSADRAKMYRAWPLSVDAERWPPGTSPGARSDSPTSPPHRHDLLANAAFAGLLSPSAAKQNFCRTWRRRSLTTGELRQQRRALQRELMFLKSRENRSPPGPYSGLMFS